MAAALIWKRKKKEPVISILIGAAAFLLFALILEKPIQNVLVFPTTMGLPQHAVSRFLNANPVLLALAAGLFPGVFEEIGRLIAFKTVLRKRRNRETSISYGIGHGGFEHLSRNQLLAVGAGGNRRSILSVYVLRRILTAL